MVAKSEPACTISSTASYRNKRYSCKQNLQGSQNPPSEVTHNKSFRVLPRFHRHYIPALKYKAVSQTVDRGYSVEEPE